MSQMSCRRHHRGVDAVRRILERQKRRAFFWLRFLTLQKLAQMHRHHLKVRARSVNREANVPHAFGMSANQRDWQLN